MANNKISGGKDLKNFDVLAEVDGKQGKKKFVLSIRAHNANYAAEKAFCIIGSKHKKARRKIVLKEVKESEAKR